MSTGAVLVVAAVGYLVWPSSSPSYDEKVTAPVGAYPPAVANSRQPRVIAHYNGVVTLLDGLALVGDNNTVPGFGKVENGIVAVDLTTGHEYWAYHRTAHGVESVRARSGAVYVLWDDGLLVRLDPRTAKIAWHRTAGATVHATSAAHLHFTADGLSVLAVGKGEVYAVEVADGSPHWHVEPDRNCAFDAGWPAITAHAVVLREQDSGPDECRAGRIQAFDPATGKPTWQYGKGSGLVQEPVDVDDTTIITAGKNPDTVVLDADTGQVERTVEALGPVILSGGNGAILDSALWNTPGQIGAMAADNGVREWTKTLPAGRTGSNEPILTDTRHVYVASTSPGAQIPDGFGTQMTARRVWLSGYDAGNGKALSDIEIPANAVSGMGQTANSEFLSGDTPYISASSPGLVAVTEVDDLRSTQGISVTYIVSTGS